MFEGDLAFSFVDLAVGLVILALGAYIFLRNPYLRLSKLFLVVTALYSVASLAAFALLNAASPSDGLLWARTMAVAIVGAFAVQLYIITLLPIEKNPRLLSDHKLLYTAIALLGAVLSVAAVQDLEMTQYGYRVQLGAGLAVLLLTVTCFVAASISLLVRLYERSPQKVRFLVLLLSAGISFPLIIMTAEAALEAAGGEHALAVPVRVPDHHHCVHVRCDRP